jgi:trimeric autotransporter adhesin
MNNRFIGLLLLLCPLAFVTSCSSPSLTSIVISPSTFTTSLAFLPNGEVAPANEQVWTQYTATGYYSHPNHPAITKDLTDQVTWVSYTPLLVTVNSSGVASVTGAATGLSQITATMPGFNGLIISNASTITVNLPSTITSSDVVSISIQPASLTVKGAGQTLGFSAIGMTGTGESVDVTSESTWTSSNAGVATMNASTPGSGKTIGVGSTTITAAFTNADGLQAVGFTNLTVN